jgi:hypothetical protein
METNVNPLSALALAISVSLIVSTIVTAVIGEFAALLVVGYQIARARPRAR